MLELSWEALEDAGIRPSSLRGSAAGVFAGAIWSDYGIRSYRGGAEGFGQYTVTGYHHSIIANRISYLLGLEGVSFTVDSACSSGLVVVHLACESLRRGESTLALAGAVNLNVLPESAVGVSRFGALSADGRCYSFDARANGYVRGEGGGLLVLKTLSRAIADGDKNGENPITVGHHHAYAVDQLSELNQQLKPHGCFMRTQQPVTIAPDSEPEPDGAIVRGSSTDYREAHPAVADVLCVFEVSDSSLHQDGTTKQRIYAEAEIPQYVLINLVDRVVEVRTNPSPAEGRYAATTTLKKGQTFTIHMPDGADLIATVENLLP